MVDESATEISAGAMLDWGSSVWRHSDSLPSAYVWFVWFVHNTSMAVLRCLVVGGGSENPQQLQKIWPDHALLHRRIRVLVSHPTDLGIISLGVYRGCMITRPVWWNWLNTARRYAASRTAA